MKKSKTKLQSKTKNISSSPALKPEEALQFLEDMRTLQAQIDEPRIAISLRIPGNLLRSLKLKAKADGKKYQSLLIEYLRKGLRENL